MNKKNLINIIIVGIVVVLIGVVGYFLFFTETDKKPELTKEIVLSLLRNETLFVDCALEGDPGFYDSCTLDISEEKEQWIAILTYDRLYDDSVKAMRFKTIINYENEQWIRGDIIRTQQCWPGRGHQDFSNEYCI